MCIRDRLYSRPSTLAVTGANVAVAPVEWAPRALTGELVRFTFCVILLGQFICDSVSYFVFSVFPVCCCLVVNINCLKRLVSEMTCYVSSGTLNPTHSLTYSSPLE